MKVIIAGGRDYSNYKQLCDYCDYILSESENIEIVSGRARGADSLGERYARERGYPMAPFPADWDAYGKSAGYKRNAEMANYADALIAFWNYKSRGTKHMIDLAMNKGLKVKIKEYDNGI